MGTEIVGQEYVTGAKLQVHNVWAAMSWGSTTGKKCDE